MEEEDLFLFNDTIDVHRSPPFLLLLLLPLLQTDERGHAVHCGGRAGVT